MDYLFPFCLAFPWKCLYTYSRVTGFNSINRRACFLYTVLRNEVFINCRGQPGLQWTPPLVWVVLDRQTRKLVFPRSACQHCKKTGSCWGPSQIPCSEAAKDLLLLVNCVLLDTPTQVRGSFRAWKLTSFWHQRIWKEWNCGIRARKDHDFLR